MLERCGEFRQRSPGVAAHTLRQVRRRRGFDLRPRLHGGVLVRPVDVEQVTGVAEGVLERDRRGGGVDVEGEVGDMLPAIRPRLQAQHHQAALRRFLVTEVREVLDQEPSRCVPAHGVSSLTARPRPRS